MFYWRCKYVLTCIRVPDANTWRVRDFRNISSFFAAYLPSATIVRPIHATPSSFTYFRQTHKETGNRASAVCTLCHTFTLNKFNI